MAPITLSPGSRELLVWHNDTVFLPLGSVSVARCRFSSSPLLSEGRSGTMAVSESDRHELYQQLERKIGKGPTETMMALLPPVGWADVATRHDLEQLEARIEAKMEAMESRINERIVRTALVVNIPTVLASFALALTAVRLGA